MTIKKLKEILKEMREQTDEIIHFETLELMLSNEKEFQDFYDFWVVCKGDFRKHFDKVNKED